MKRAVAGVWSRHQSARRSMSSAGTAANRQRPIRPRTSGAR